MKEHPILFNTEMVQAILEGYKTQTRRVVKPQPYITERHYLNASHRNGNSFLFKNLQDNRLLICECPYGQVGDRLWVRETWVEDRIPQFKESQRGTVHYKADNIPVITESWAGHWKPSIFMPRWASRITLEITDIRVQRLQEIGYDDAIAEGVSKEMGLRFGFASPYPEDKYLLMLARHIYVALWDSINGKRSINLSATNGKTVYEYSWIANPWVWVIEFKKV